MTVQSREESDGTVVLVTAAESLDQSNALEFREAAVKAIVASAGRLLVDCSSLEFVDSSGVGALLHAHNNLPENRRPVKLTGVGSKVLTILELMQVHRLFELEPKK
jgi:anti-sigma B factor antagonist